VIKLCVLSPDDWPLWRRLRLAALAEAPYAFGSRLADWQGDGDRAERWRDRLALPGSYNVVALLDEQPAGMASGVPADEPGVVEAAERLYRRCGFVGTGVAPDGVPPEDVMEKAWPTVT
jgi:hypothetical protein